MDYYWCMMDRRLGVLRQVVCYPECVHSAMALNHTDVRAIINIRVIAPSTIPLCSSVPIWQCTCGLCFCKQHTAAARTQDAVKNMFTKPVIKPSSSALKQ